MEEVAKLLQSVVQSYGFWGAVAVIVIMIVTQLVKWPLKKKAEEWAEKANIDKKAVTVWFVFIPVLVSLIVTFVFYSWRGVGWDYSQFSWASYFSQASVLSSVSVALYEAIDACVKAKLAKEKKAIAQASGSAEVESLSASQIVSAYSKVKASSKAAKKAAKENAKVVAKAKKIESLKAELAELESNGSEKATSASANVAPAVAVETKSVVKID